MTYTLRAGPKTGRIDDEDLGSFEIEDSQIEVDEYDVAERLIERYSVEWYDGDPGPPRESSDDSDAQETLVAEDQAGGDEDDEDDEDDESDGWTRSDLEEKAYDELRSLAAEADTDEINGHSARDEIIDVLAEGTEV